MTSAAVKLYTIVVAVLCAAAVAWTINQSTAASAWRAEARSWQAAARRTVAQERALTHRYRHLAVQYNHLVVHTRRSQRALIARMQTAQATVPPAATSSPVSTTASVSVAAPAPAPSAPTTRAS